MANKVLKISWQQMNHEQYEDEKKAGTGCSRDSEADMQGL